MPPDDMEYKIRPVIYIKLKFLEEQKVAEASTSCAALAMSEMNFIKHCETM